MSGNLTRAVLSALIVLAAASSGLTQSAQINRADALSAGQATSSPQPDRQDDPVTALAELSQSLPPASGAQSFHAAGQYALAGQNQSFGSMRDFLQQLHEGAAQPVEADQPQNEPDLASDAAYSALSAFAREIGSGDPPVRLAEAKQAKQATPKKAVVKATGDVEATFVGSQACMGCHATHAAAFGQTIMGRIFRNPRNAQERGGCETCHGAGSLHVKAGGGRGVGGIISFRKEDTSRSVADNNAICLSCHDKGDRLHWQGSTHETREVACTNCHTVMRNVSARFQLKTVNEIDTCFQCHKNKRAEIWRSSHMPIREGKMACSSCHNPHGTFSESLLKEASVNDTCYKCHAEKRGPFLFEHAPVRESCLNCHDPHGSTNEYLLKVSRPRLCQQCHSTVGGHPSNPRNPVSVFAINRECQNCHSQHHGSNSPSGARFQR